MYKKLLSSVVVVFFVILSKASLGGEPERYTLTGPVENVSYNNSSWPCYVAITRFNDNDNPRRNHFHASKNLEICRFAERSKIIGQRVTIYAYVDTGANVVDQIEYANTNAVYWER